MKLASAPASDHSIEGKNNGLIFARLHGDRPHFIHSFIVGQNNT